VNIEIELDIDLKMKFFLEQLKSLRAPWDKTLIGNILGTHVKYDITI